jgi:SAM-dependent methyltransferase
MNDQPGWKRLWRHSYRLGFRWLLRRARRGWPERRVGFARLLVPLDPWRYYELGRVAEAQFAGRCLDVSSPKLLPSLLQHEGKGDWTAIDLFEREIAAWREIDPGLALQVEDASDLPYEDSSFDHSICVSVVEHVPDDTQALAEIWRTLKPGGILHLTTNVALESRDVFVDEEPYGEASKSVDGKVFFERHYTEEDLERRLLARPWQTLDREFARQIDPSIEERFYRRAPRSFLYGGLLRFRCPDNFELGDSTGILQPGEQGVVYLRLQKPEEPA